MSFGMCGCWIRNKWLQIVRYSRVCAWNELSVTPSVQYCWDDWNDRTHYNHAFYTFIVHVKIISHVDSDNCLSHTNLACARNHNCGCVVRKGLLRAIFCVYVFLIRVYDFPKECIICVEYDAWVVWPWLVRRDNVEHYSVIVLWGLRVGSRVCVCVCVCVIFVLLVLFSEWESTTTGFVFIQIVFHLFAISIYYMDVKYLVKFLLLLS